MDGTTEKPKVFFLNVIRIDRAMVHIFLFFRDLGERPTTASTAVWEARAGDTGEICDCKF